MANGKNKQQKRSSAKPAKKAQVRRPNKATKPKKQKSGPRRSNVFGRTLADPFNHSACLPDGSMNTGCFSLKQTGTFETGTGGSACGIALLPQPNAFYFTDTASTIALTDFPAASSWNQAANLATIAGFYKAYRIVSAGLKLTYTGSTLNDQGIIVAAQLPAQSTLSSYDNMSATQLAAGAQCYKTFPVRDGAYITWRPESVSDVSTWRAMSTSSATLNSTVSVPVLVASVFGGATNGACSFQWELILNVEGQYQTTNFIGGGVNSIADTTRTPEPGWYEHGLAYVNTIPQTMTYVAAAAATGLVGRYAKRFIASSSRGAL